VIRRARNAKEAVTLYYGAYPQSSADACRRTIAVVSAPGGGKLIEPEPESRDITVPPSDVPPPATGCGSRHAAAPRARPVKLSGISRPQDNTSSRFDGMARQDHPPRTQGSGGRGMTRRSAAPSVGGQAIGGVSPGPRPENWQILSQCRECERQYERAYYPRSTAHSQEYPLLRDRASLDQQYSREFGPIAWRSRQWSRVRL